MKHTYSPEHAPRYLRVMEVFDDAAKAIPEELFKWLAWGSGIAALRIVEQKTAAAWLVWLWPILLFILVWRIQWFIGRKLRFPEEKQPDGSVVVTFSAPRLLLALAMSAASWWFIIALSNAITDAGLVVAKSQQTATASQPRPFRPAPLKPTPKPEPEALLPSHESTPEAPKSSMEPKRS
ncbi:hypothetical protein [Lysobacter changpingensis]|uniref:hypothetical protein n=1 Tax=Lysobacter changpingensis TaxID=2792784 RepID=UPI001A8C485F|nr:hypothetical protein [Lysobacter changpingensis]